MRGQERNNMIEEFYHIMDQWLTLYEEGRSIGDILEEKGYLSIAILGMGAMAIHIVDSLKGSKVEVKYIIDTDIAVYGNGMMTKSQEDQFDELDALIYTNPFENPDVIKIMKEKMACRAVSLSDVVFDNLEL